LDKEVHDWLRLTQIHGVGSETARKLLAVFGLPEQIFSASFDDLSHLIGGKLAHRILAKPDADFYSLLEKTIHWCSLPQRRLLTLADTDYPSALLNIPDPPVLLYVLGNFQLLHTASLAVVGSRHASVQGKKHAHDFSLNLSRAGFCISSGLAAGIDAAAHLGGLSGPASTIAVIGTGIDKIYPTSNRELAIRIANEGCVVSEYPLGTSPLSYNFPRRNRIIAGLAKGVLVIEAAEKSGSLITARMALEQGRDVFAIPGSIMSPQSKGCHLLIKQGANLVDGVDDLLNYYSMPTSIHTQNLPTVQAHPILNSMGFDPIHVDEIAQRMNLEVAYLISELLMLELDGCVEILGGSRYRRLI
jgi:DNA processing protein